VTAAPVGESLQTTIWPKFQGQAEKMIGKLQERYGYKREQAEKELNDFLNAPPRTRRTA
jgi:hypothetical protein